MPLKGIAHFSPSDISPSKRDFKTLRAMISRERNPSNPQADGNAIRPSAYSNGGNIPGSTGAPDLRPIELGNSYTYRTEAMGDPVYALFDFGSGRRDQVSRGPTFSCI
jgi:hypothetical protein